MKLYTTIDFEYNRRYNNKISSATMTYMLKQIMATDATRKYALDLFADFKESDGHSNTQNFRSLLAFNEDEDEDERLQNKKKKKNKALHNILNNSLTE